MHWQSLPGIAARAQPDDFFRGSGRERMGRNTKWIDSQPDDLVDDVARRALEVRLDRLWYFLEQAVVEPNSETENVHQLRVFTRRAGASMEIFAELLPKRRGRWMRKQLKRLRQAAGEARDLDVLRLRWAAQLDEGTATLAQGAASSLKLLLEQASRRRRKAQWPIEEIYQKLLRKNFARRTKKLLKRIRVRDAKTPGSQPTGNNQPAADLHLGAVAHQQLDQLVEPYLKAAEADMVDAPVLHAFRIQGKEIRYAMEIFAGAFEADFRQELYPLVAELQDRLGAINDHVTAQEYLSAWGEETASSAVREAVAAGLQIEQAAFDESRRDFLTWWTPERRSSLRRQFAKYLPLDRAIESLPTAPRQDIA